MMREHMEVEMPRTIPCPFVYWRGKQCLGHIVRVEAYKADLEWNFSADDAWSFGWTPRSHYHLFCSEKDNHAGANRDDALKFYWEDLPAELRARLLYIVSAGTKASWIEMEEWRRAKLEEGKTDPGSDRPNRRAG